MTKPGFLEEVEKKGNYLRRLLEELVKEFSVLLSSVRGKGLMLGLVCKRECKDIVKLALEKGLIINCTAGNVLRFVPPLVISREEIDTGVSILREVLKSYAD
jgi:acetylornithine/succinyldiaminopimelate/putrescine aminotransferase